MTLSSVVLWVVRWPTWWQVARARLILDRSLLLALTWVLLPLLGWPLVGDLITTPLQLALWLFVTFLAAPVLVGYTLPRDLSSQSWRWDLTLVPLLAYGSVVLGLVAAEAAFLDLATQRSAREALVLADHVGVLFALRHLVVSPIGATVVVPLELSSLAGLYLGSWLPRPPSFRERRRS